MAGNKLMLSERVVTELLEMITVEKRFQPGDKLPNESELCETFGVSRTTLREAIRSLVAYNVVTVQRGRGTYVAHNDELKNDFGFGDLESVLLGAKDVFEMRSIIEPQAASLAVERASDEELEKILDLGRRAGGLNTAGLDYTEDEQSFHASIARSTHNEFMMRVVPIINRGVWSGIMAARDDDELNAIADDARDILLFFLRTRNAKGARLAMQLHIMLGAMKIGLEP